MNQKNYLILIQRIISSLLQSVQKRSIKIGKNNSNNQLLNIIHINTAEFNEQSTGVKQLPRYAICMEGELLQFAKPISNVLNSIIKTHSLSSEARRYAIETFNPLINCLKCGLIIQFTEELIDSLIDSMNISDEVDEFSLIKNSFSNYISSNKFTNVSIINDISEQFNVAMNERQERKKINEEKSTNLIDFEADLSDTIVDLISILDCKFGDKYLNKQCIDLINSNHENHQILSYGILTEIIRYCGNNSNKYIQYILKMQLVYLEKYVKIYN